MVYIWSKANHKQIVNLFGFIMIRAGYLPYFFFFWSLLLRGSLFFDVLGLMIGHVFYYLYFVVPKLPFTRGKNVLEAPKFVKHLIGFLQLDSKRELILEDGDFVADDDFIPNVR